MKTSLMLTVAVVAASFGAGSASAATMLFELSGSRNATWTLNMNPMPDSFTALQTNFFNVSGTFNGEPGVAALINFGGQPGIAALNITGTSLGFTQFSGPRLFQGPTSNPVFVAGTFQLNSIVSGRSTLTISELPSAVPEASTWAMLIAGFGFVGWAMRRRRQVARAIG
ncbi:MAG: PEPxxWA-CTERM sorting domain-containing protein [Thermaurantiacus sp.]